MDGWEASEEFELWPGSKEDVSPEEVDAYIKRAKAFLAEKVVDNRRAWRETMELYEEINDHVEAESEYEIDIGLVNFMAALCSAQLCLIQLEDSVDEMVEAQEEDVRRN